MPRLPQVGSDSGNWGTLLNEYLGVSHTSDGKLLFEKWADNASRPENLSVDQVGYNEDTRVIEQFDGTNWVTLAGGIQDNTLDPTKLNAQTQFLERFALRPNGHTIVKNVLPEIGNKFYLAGNAVSNPPSVIDGGLVAAPNSLYYIGGQHTEPIKSMTIEVEFRQSVIPGGVGFAGITVSFSRYPLFFDENNTFGTPPNFLHFSSSRGGPNGFGINQNANGVNFQGIAQVQNGVTWGPTTASGIPFNVKTFITFRFEGDECWVTCMGYTQYFKDPRITQDGLGSTWWWYETEGDSNLMQNYSIWHRMWINSPHIDLVPGVNQPFSEILARLSSGSPVLPQKITIMGENTSFSTNNPSDSDSLSIAGSIWAQKYKAKPYLNHGTYSPAHGIYSISAPLSSAAPSNNLVLGPNISFFGLNQLGERDEFVIRGYFANNSNTKRLRVNSGAIGDIFDSGDLTTANKEWEIRLVRTVQTGIFLAINVTFTIDGQNPILRYFSSNYNVAFNAALRVTGTLAGDVVVRSGTGSRFTI